jgi:hypothetical protein
MNKKEWLIALLSGEKCVSNLCYDYDYIYYSDETDMFEYKNKGTVDIRCHNYMFGIYEPKKEVVVDESEFIDLYKFAYHLHSTKWIETENFHETEAEVREIYKTEKVLRIKHSKTRVKRSSYKGGK